MSLYPKCGFLCLGWHLALLFVPLYWSCNQNFKVPGRLQLRPGSRADVASHLPTSKPRNLPCAHTGRRGAATKGAAGQGRGRRCTTRHTTTQPGLALARQGAGTQGRGAVILPGSMAQQVRKSWGPCRPRSGQNSKDPIDLALSCFCLFVSLIYGLREP